MRYDLTAPTLGTVVFLDSLKKIGSVDWRYTKSVETVSAFERLEHNQQAIELARLLDVIE